MLPVLVAVAVVVAVVTLYLAYRSVGFSKFLAGAFFVSAGVQFYLYAAKVDVPVLGTDFVQTPDISAVRGSVHLALFILMLYLGFFRSARDK